MPLGDVSVCSEKIAAPWEKSFCVLEYHTSKSVVTVQRAFRAKYAKDPPTWPRWLKGTEHFSSEVYRYTHVDACVARTWISYRCVSCHPWCTHRTSLVVKRSFFSFPVAVNNSINPLNPELNPICYLLALLGAHHFLHVSRISVKLLTFRRLMSYIYIWSTYSWCF